MKFYLHLVPGKKKTQKYYEFKHFNTKNLSMESKLKYLMRTKQTTFQGNDLSQKFIKFAVLGFKDRFGRFSEQRR